MASSKASVKTSAKKTSAKRPSLPKKTTKTPAKKLGSKASATASTKKPSAPTASVKALKLVQKSSAKKTSKKPVFAKGAVKKPTPQRITGPIVVSPFAFAWHDLMTHDVKAARTFYGKVVGWKFGKQRPDYDLLMVGKAAIGGMMTTPPHLREMPPFWSGYIAVNNVDATCKQIAKVGGKIHRTPWDIPGMLRMAVVSDPMGAVFNLFHPLTAAGDDFPEPGVPGTVGWNELMTADVKKATKFYAREFGWTKGQAINLGTETGIYQLMQVSDVDHAGLMKRPSFIPMDHWGFYFWVDGINAAAIRIKKAGGNITHGPMPVPGGQFVVQAQDPQGAHFGLISTRQ
jgi:uncharacterized protein